MALPCLIYCTRHAVPAITLPSAAPTDAHVSSFSGIYALAFWYAGQLVGSGENTFEEVLKV